MNWFSKKQAYHENDQESLIEACLNRNALAQKALIRQHFGFAMNISRRFASTEEDAEEILNDSFLKVFNKLATFNRHQPFRAWLRTIVVHTAIDYYRKSLNEPQRQSLETFDISGVSEDAINQISAQEIMSLVQKLSPAYRMVFTLYVIEGYTHKEIAEKLNIHEGTSKSNLQDARIKLQRMIVKMNNEQYITYDKTATLK